MTAGGTPNDGATARAGDAEARARNGAATVRTDGARGRPDTVIADNVKGEVEEGSESRKVTLSIKGGPGTGFSGVCSVGAKERALDGRAPERYDFEPGGGGLECEIPKKGEGALEVVATSGEGARSAQRIAIRGGSTVGFTVLVDSVSSFSSVSVNRGTATSGRCVNSSR